MATYNYPIDQDDYGARVTFGIIKTEPTGATSANSGLQQQIDANNRAIKALNERADELKAEVDADNKSNAQLQEELRQIDSEVRELIAQNENFQGLQNQSEVAPTIETKADQGDDYQPTVSLYLPLGLAFRDNVTYENFDLGAMGAAMEAGQGFAESMFKGVGSFVSNLKGGSGADVARLAGIQLAGQAGSFGDESRAVQRLAGGVTLNPNSRVLFKQPNIREFAFAFKFFARSKEEQEQVKSIIKFFRTELYPSEISASVGNTDIALGYRFPNKFDIRFNYKGTEIDGLAKIQPCYLRDVSTTFNSSQMAMHSDGSFLEVDMTLNFQETRALTRTQVEEGGF